MKIKNLILAGLIGATLSISVAPSPTVEAYAGITSEQERQIGKTAFDKDFPAGTYKVSERMTDMAKEIVEANKNELNFYDGVHKRWLNDVIYEYKADEEPNAHSYPGGYIIFNTTLLDFCAGESNYGAIGYPDAGEWRGSTRADVKKGDAGALYARGMALAVMAHEISHYSNEDYNRVVSDKAKTNTFAQIAGIFVPQTETGMLAYDIAIQFANMMSKKGYTKADEIGADKTAMKYMKNLEYNGIGDSAAYYFRLGQRRIHYGDMSPWEESKSHPSPYNRLKMHLDEIKKMTNGRFEFREIANSLEDTKLGGEYSGAITAAVQWPKLNYYINSTTGKKEDAYSREFILCVDGQPMSGKDFDVKAIYGLLPSNICVSRQDRTFHAVGQIASAIDLGIFKPENIGFEEISRAHNYDECSKNGYGLTDGGMTGVGYIYFEGIGKDGKRHKKYIDLIHTDKLVFDAVVHERKHPRSREIKEAMMKEMGITNFGHLLKIQYPDAEASIIKLIYDWSCGKAS